MAKNKYYDLIGVLRTSESFGEYKVLEVVENGSQVKLWLFKIVFEDTKHEYFEKWDKIRKNKVKDLKLIKQQKAEKTRKKIIERNRLVKKNTSHYSLENINTKYTLMLDWSTSNTGISLWEGSEHLISKSYGSENNCFRTRSNEISKSVCSILDYCDNDVVVLIENLYLGLNSSILSILAESRGYITKELIERNIRFELIPATKVRHDMNAPIHRGDIKKWAMEFYKEKTGLIAEDDDLADAFVIGYWLNISRMEG